HQPEFAGAPDMDFRADHQFQTRLVRREKRVRAGQNGRDARSSDEPHSDPAIGRCRNGVTMEKSTRKISHRTVFVTALIYFACSACAPLALAQSSLPAASAWKHI